MKISAKTNVGTLLLTGLLLCCILFQATFFRIFLTIIYPREYSGEVIESAVEFGVDPSLVYAVIKTESDFDPYAHSSAGACGIMQITPDTFEWLQMRMKNDTYLQSEEMYDPAINIRYGTYFLSLLKKEFDADETVMSAYHAGRGKVNDWLEDKALSEDGKSLCRIPYPSTNSYVHQVMRNYKIYQALYK